MKKRITITLITLITLFGFYGCSKFPQLEHAYRVSFEQINRFEVKTININAGIVLITDTQTQSQYLSNKNGGLIKLDSIPLSPSNVN